MNKAVLIKVLNDWSNEPGIRAVERDTYVLAVLDASGNAIYYHPRAGVEWFSAPEDFEVAQRDLLIGDLAFA